MNTQILTNNVVSALCAVFAILLISGCSTTLDNNNKNSQTVRELYQHNNNYNIDKFHKKQEPTYRAHQAQNTNNWIREQGNELDNRFPQIHNPTLNMFVFPHLINNSHPVPGYTTNFKMYEVDHYALPQEIY